jgi:hypothetical protein
MSNHWLESVFWASQAILAVIALFAALVAFSQVRTTKLFEILKYLESPELRKSRRKVFKEIYPRRREPWWNDDKDGNLESAASDVCASYDILGKIIEFDRVERILPSYGRFFTRHWARSILDNHDALENFLAYRRERVPTAYASFTSLAQAARRTNPTTNAPFQER